MPIPPSSSTLNPQPSSLSSNTHSTSALSPQSSTHLYPSRAIDSTYDAAAYNAAAHNGAAFHASAHYASLLCRCSPCRCSPWQVIDSFEALTKRLGDLTDAPAGTLHSSASSPSRRLRQPSAELAKGWRSGLGSGSRGGIPGGVDPKRDRRPRSGGVRCQNGHHHDGSRHVAAHAITAHDGLQGDGAESIAIC